MAYILVRVVPMLAMSHNSLYTFLFFCLRPCFHEPGATSCTEFVCVHTSPGQFYPGTILSRDSFIPGHFRAGIQNFSADDNYAFERNKYRFTLCYFDKYHREHFVRTGHFHFFCCLYDGRSIWST